MSGRSATTKATTVTVRVTAHRIGLAKPTPGESYHFSTLPKRTVQYPNSYCLSIRSRTSVDYSTVLVIRLPRTSNVPSTRLYHTLHRGVTTLFLRPFLLRQSAGAFLGKSVAGAMLNVHRWFALALDALQEVPEAVGRIEVDGGQ